MTACFCSVAGDGPATRIRRKPKLNGLKGIALKLQDLVAVGSSQWQATTKRTVALQVVAHTNLPHSDLVSCAAPQA